MTTESWYCTGCGQAVEPKGSSTDAHDRWRTGSHCEGQRVFIRDRDQAEALAEQARDLRRARRAAARVIGP